MMGRCPTTVLWRSVPQAALLEGAEFLAYQQLEHGTKAHPVFPSSP